MQSHAEASRKILEKSALDPKCAKLDESLNLFISKPTVDGMHSETPKGKYLEKFNENIQRIFKEYMQEYIRNI